MAIKTTVTNAFNRAVTLSATGLSSTLGAVFSPATIADANGGSSTMILEPSSTLQPGAFRIYVKGAISGATVSVPVTISVQ